MQRIHLPLKRLGVGAILAAGLLATAVPAALASGPTPFVGSFTEAFTIVNPPPVLVANASGSGSVSPLGPATESFVGVVNFSAIDSKTGCAYDSSTGSVAATNGDKVFVTSVGEFCAATGIDSGVFVITGGTGQYAGASGGGRYTATADLAGGTASEQYNGAIRLP